MRVLFDDPRAYCVATTTSAGCVPAIGASGLPSASHASGFVVSAAQVPNDKSGLLFYGLDGKALTPFQGGTLCVNGPRRRSPILQSGGNVAPANADCSGAFQLDLNAFAAGQAGGWPHPGLTLVGQQVNVQFWGRDPLGLGGLFLSDALEYVVGP